MTPNYPDYRPGAHIDMDEQGRVADLANLHSAFTLGGGAALSGTSFSGESGNSVLSPDEEGYFGQITGYSPAIPNPTDAPVLSQSATGGLLFDGDYVVAYTFTNIVGETLLSPQTPITLSGGTDTQTINVGAITPESGALGLNYYVSDAPGSTTLQLQNQSPADGSAYVIETPGSLGATPTGNVTDGYSFTEYEGTTNYWIAKPGGMVGDVTGAGAGPAREINGNTQVAVGTMVRLWLAESGLYWWFDAGGGANRQFVRMVMDQVPETSPEYVAGHNAMVQTFTAGAWTDTAESLEATCPDQLPLRANDYFWVEYQSEAGKWVPTTIVRNAPIALYTTIVNTVTGLLPCFVAQFDVPTRSWLLGSFSWLIDANNVGNPQLLANRIYDGADLVGHTNGYCVYSTSCCGTTAVPLPPPPPPPSIPPPPPPTQLCVGCTISPSCLTITLTGFSGGATIGPSTGGCSSCTVTPTAYTVDLTAGGGFTGDFALITGTISLDNSNLGPCGYTYTDPSNAWYAGMYIGGTTVTLGLVVGSKFVEYTGTISSMDCCSAISLAVSDHVGTGTYPDPIILTPTCVPTPVDGCSEAVLGAITLKITGNCQWGYAANGVIITVTYNSGTWTLAGSTTGGCAFVYAGPGDCCLTGGVTLTKVLVSGTGPSTLTLAALSACDNTVAACPPIAAGTISSPCCPTDLVPATLHVTLTDAGNLACLDGLQFLITYDPSGGGSWHDDGTVTAVCGGGTVPVNVILQCLGSDITKWALYITCDNVNNGTYPVTSPDGGATCAPFVLEYTGVDMGVAPCSTPAVGTIDVLISE